MKFILMLITFLLLTTVSLFADSEVYRWTDKTGVVHYSSSQPSEDAKPADLPPIMREKNLAKAPIPLTASCTSHGGIACAKGMDQDGSVICEDGFLDAAARFQFRCLTTKLLATEVTPPEEDGLIKIWIRNDRDVEAKDVKIKVKDQAGELIEALGPSTVAPSELAEFKLKKPDNLNAALSTNDVVISCANCG